MVTSKLAGVAQEGCMEVNPLIFTVSMSSDTILNISIDV